MEHLGETLPLLAAPLAACVVIALLHCYMGLHVIQRGVIFVDLALAQMAALGAAVALLTGSVLFAHHAEHPEHDEAGGGGHMHVEELLDDLDGDLGVPEAALERAEHAHGHLPRQFVYALSVGFALLGAAVLALGRFRDERVPHEAVIGIVFVVAAAVTVLILSKAPHGHEKMEAMLVGSILFVRWEEVYATAGLYLVLGIVHVLCRRPMLAISRDLAGAEAAGVRVRLWDCLFYATFAVMVTQSVAIGGVLVVFSFLIIPAACAALFAERFGPRLLVAWLVAGIATVAGLCFSAVLDMPTGSSLVSMFGAVLLVSVVVRRLVRGLSRERSHAGNTEGV